MISNIHFENTRNNSWVLEGRSVQAIGGFYYHTKFGTPLWGVCMSQFWEQKLYMYHMINKIVSSWGENLIIILHGLWRMAPFCSQSAPLRDLHQGCIRRFYTVDCHSKSPSTQIFAPPNFVRGIHHALLGWELGCHLEPPLHISLFFCKKKIRLSL